LPIAHGCAGDPIRAPRGARVAANPRMITVRGSEASPPHDGL